MPVIMASDTVLLNVNVIYPEYNTHIVKFPGFDSTGNVNFNYIQSLTRCCVLTLTAQAQEMVRIRSTPRFY
jgi:hypothetical protein